MPADSNSYSDLTAHAGTTYYYRVSAFNAADVSAYSSQAIVTTIPAVPGSLTATPLWSSTIELAWGSVFGETGFKIDRSGDGGSTWVQIAAPGANATKYQDLRLQAASTYTYRVWAVNAAGDSAPSNLASATTLAASPTSFGSQDGAFIVESWSGAYNELKIQPGDQKILAAGTKYSTDPSALNDHRMAIARYAAGGGADTTYGTGGLSSPALGSSLEYGNGLALQPDGKAIVTGVGGAGHAVARFNTNGSLDSGFGNGGWNSIDVVPTDFYQVANAVGLQSTGKIVVGGFTLDTTTTVDPAVLARYTASGAVDSGKNGFGKVTQGKAPGYALATFGGTINSFNDLAIQSDDKVVVVGHSVNGADGGLLVARYTANGVLDTSFNGSGSTVLLPAGATFARASGIALQADGKIIIVGSCTGIDGSSDMLVARYLASGNNAGKLDTTFGGGTGYVRLDIDGTASPTSEGGSDVVIQPDGKIVVAGGHSVAGGVSDILVVRINANGTLDSAFGDGGFKTAALPTDLAPPQGLTATSVALLNDGNILVSGYGNWTPTGGTYSLQNSHPLLMRFSGANNAAAPAASSAAATDAALLWLLSEDLTPSTRRK